MLSLNYDETMATLFLFLLVMSWYKSSSAIHHPRKWQLADVACDVTSQFDSQLASAFLEKELPTSGCVTNATVKKSGAEVHVIHYHGETGQNLELLLNDYDKRGFDEPFVIVLSSNITVYWQVRLRQNPKNLGKHSFVVTKGCGLRFAYKHVTSRPSILKPKHMPHDPDQLVDWVFRRFSVVTSFTSVQGGNHLIATIGQAQASSLSSSSSSSPSSTLSPTSSSPSTSSLSSSCTLTSDEQEEVNVKSISMTIRPVEGCLMKKRYTGPVFKVAYVIELKHISNVQKFDVNLHLRGHLKQQRERETKLVLKAPRQVTWRVHTKKIQGLIHIVANSYVDMSGIRVETVSVRSEELQESGLDLLRWVQYYLEVPIVMYTSMNYSNRIQITLPEIEEKDVINAKQMKINLRNSLTTECGVRSVIVAVDKAVIQMLGVERRMLSLLDPMCTASENSTHVYIETSQGKCGTSLIHTQFGQLAVANALVVHDSNVMADRDSITEASGMEDVFSGSGEISNIVLDDEDLELQPLHVNFMCVLVKQPQPEDLQPQPDIYHEPELQLQLFDNVFFLSPFTQFPVKVMQSHTRLYLQAIVMSDPLLRANMAHCWLSEQYEHSENNKYSLVEERCGSDDSIQYLQTGNPQSERLSFTLENYVKHATSATVLLQCRINTCCINRKCGTYSYPLCPDHSLECESRKKDDNANGTRLIILGTLSLPQQVTNYNENIDNSLVEVEKDAWETGPIEDRRNKDPVVIEGLDSVTVVGIAFAAFIIGALMMGALWFIHTHSGTFFSSGPFKRSMGTREAPENDGGYIDSTPGSSVPIST